MYRIRVQTSVSILIELDGYRNQVPS